MAKLEALRRRGHSFSPRLNQAERDDETLKLLLKYWLNFPIDTKLAIKWLAWRGAAGHREFIPHTGDNGNGGDGHYIQGNRVYLSDGSIPSEAELIEIVKKFRS